jgi:uncharacterized protein YndB with AHSA1/START domain
MPNIVHRVGIRASAERVFAALSEEQSLAGWWTRDVKAWPAVGAINQFRFGNNGFNEMKVVELSPAKRVKWLCVNGAKEWIGTELTFDLREADGTTVLLFAQRGWKEQVEFMHYCSTKWGTYLVGLKSFCQVGVSSDAKCNRRRGRRDT